MPVNGFNIGKDVTLDIVDAVQGPLRFKIKTRFEADPEYKDLRSEALDGVNRFGYVPAGHKLTFEFDRGDARVDDYFAARESDYFNGVVLPNVSVTETISNPDGSVSQYRYTDVALKLDKSGSFKSDSIVTQTISGMAARKVRIS